MDPSGSGCAFPLEKAGLVPGLKVLDLGCGVGAEALAAAEQVQPGGFVYGLDKSSEALAAARKGADELGLDNVRFIEGFMEDVPLEDELVDVIVSNCAINLCLDRRASLAQAYRVLKPRGRLVLADIVLLGKDTPLEVEQVVAPLLGCVQGVLSLGAYVDLLEDCGFTDIATEIFLRFDLGRIRSRAQKHAASEVLTALEDPAFAKAVHGAFASVYLTART